MADKLKEIQAEVSGMHCAACSSRIEKVVGAMDGVDNVSVNLPGESMKVSFDPDILSPETIAESVAGLGFKAEMPEETEGEVAIDLGISGMHCAACSSRIEKVVGGLNGVSHAQVNLPAESGHFIFDPNVISQQEVREAIDSLGFKAKPISAAAGMFAKRQEQARQRLAAMKRRIIPAFVFALPLLIISMGHDMGMPLPSWMAAHTAPLTFALVQLALTLPVIWSGRNFYINGFPTLWHWAPNMDSLIAVGTGAAFLYSLWNTIEIGLGVDVMVRVMDLYYESAAVLIALVSLGKYFEARSTLKTSGAIQKLMELSPDTATLLKNGEQVQVPAADLVPGDMILIKPGERVAADGSVTEGYSSVDESMLTGESLPVTKEEGSTVTGGTLNAQGVLTVRVERVGQDTALARIIKLVQEAQGSKAPIANLADTISYYFVPVVIALAIISFFGWYLVGGEDFATSLRIFIAVLVIACPCAMGLATPTSIMVGTGRGAQLGVLVKSGGALQTAGEIKSIIFDKTGTLTKGKPELTDVAVFDGTDSDTALAMAAAIEGLSEHPLALAIVAGAAEKNLSLPTVDAFEAKTGRGVQATVSGQTVLIGNVEYMQESGVSGVEAALAQANTFSEQGKTALYMAQNGKATAVLAVADTLKPEAPGVIKELHDLGLRVAMITGDNETTAKAVARQAGIDKVMAQVLPENKASEVAKLQDQGMKTAMVGDGINDAPALAKADVGIAMGTGIDVAVESGDIVVISGELTGVTTGLRLSRAVMRNIKQNLVWAFGYNILGIPVAMGVLHIFGGPTLSPMIAGAAMAMSSVSVVTNALRLRFFK